MLFSVLSQTNNGVEQVLAWLAETSLQLRNCRQVETLLETGVQHTQRLFEGDRVLICRASADWDGIVVAEAVAAGWPSLLNREIYLPRLSLQSSTFISNPAFIAIDQLTTSQLDAAEIAALTQCQVQGYLATPIWINAPHQQAGEGAPSLWGWLIVHQCQADCHWQPGHGRLLQQIATQIGDTLERLQLHQHLESVESQTAATAAKYQQATQACSIGVWDWDLQTNDIHLDPLLKAMLGYRDDEIRNHIDDWVQYVYEADLPAVMAAATEHLAGRSPAYRVEHRMVHREGHLVWVLAHGTAFRSPDGTPYRMVGTDIDITDRKMAELALAKQTQQEQAFNDVMQAVRKSLDLDTIFWEAAAAIADFLDGEVSIVQYLPTQGCWRHQVVYPHGTCQVTKPCVDVPDADNPFAEQLKRLEVVQVDDTAMIRDPINRQLAENSPHRAWLIVPISDKSTIWGALTLARSAQPLPWQTDEVQLAQRVADQLAIAIHQANLYRQLQSAHQRDALVLKSIGEGVWDWDPNEDVILDSDRYWEILGYAPHKQGLSSFVKELERIHPDDRAMVRHTAYQHLSTGEPFSMEFRMRHRQGDYLWIRARGQAVLNEQGHPIRMLGTIEDISDRVTAEVSLRQREAEFRTLAENSPDGILRMNAAQQIQYVNPTIERRMAMPQAELLGKHLSELGFSAPVLGQWQTAIDQAFDSGQEQQLETEELLPSGLYSFQSRIVPERDEPGEILSVLIVSRDITSLKRAQNALLRRVNHEYSLRMITQHIRKTLDFNAILATVVAEVQQALQADRTLVFQLMSDHSGVVMQERSRPEYPVTLAMRWEDEHFPPACYEFYQQGQGRIVEDITQDDWGACLAEFMQSVGVQSKMVAPVTQNQADGTVQVWGLLIVHACSTCRHWEADELELLQQVAQQLAIALQQSALHQQLLAANQELEYLSTTDGLTRIANRRRFDHTLTVEWQRAHREQQELTLILCDIDHFKQYNDTYGHPAGDDCLIGVAQTLQGCVNRSTDCVARYGGEEFGVILPQTNLAGAIVIVQHMQAAIAALHITHHTHPTSPHVTLSFGIAVAMPSSSLTVGELLKRADLALYQAKQAGRDCYAIV
jgi:diguanylate cyclase (GGDEF)-like protein/PAS domain S-box-containing protein